MKKALHIIFFPVVLLLRAIDNIRISSMLRHITINDIDKVSGTDFEKIVVFMFKKMHFRVRTTPVTGDYGADLIASKWGIKIAIQCKLYFGHNVGNKAINEAYTAKSYYGCDVAMVISNSNYTSNAIKLANSLKVSLLSRDELKKLLNSYSKNGANIVKKAILTSCEQKRI